MRSRMNVVALLVFFGGRLVLAVPLISDVSMTQRANSRIVDITYTLADEAAIVTLGIETNGVALPASAVTSLAGDVSRVISTGGVKHIIWNAGKDWPENATGSAKARVTAWCTNAPPQYCVVDVTGGAAATTYPLFYYTSAEAVPGRVTNDLYKTYRILMRRIEATGGQGFTMGSPTEEIGRNQDSEAQVNVVLTKDYYVGVYQVTQRQWYQVVGDIVGREWPSKYYNQAYRQTRPVEMVSYVEIRGTPAQGDAGWPTDDNVSADSFMGRLRSKTGLSGFNLPTDAQWEYACRAGTGGALNNGTVNLSQTDSDPQMSLLGRYRYNGGQVMSTTDPSPGCTTENGTAAVGSYVPNAWGIYDMHGNVWELCLDWYTVVLTGITDPVGAPSGLKRVIRGGAWYSSAYSCRSALRESFDPASTNHGVGFRLVGNLP